MNWDVFWRLSGLEIQLHWATATLAFFLGIVIFARRKGDIPHRSLGAAYAALMIFTAAAAFFMRSGEVSGLEYLSLKGMSWIHIFIPMTLGGVISGLVGILILKDKNRHKWPLISSYFGALIIAGAFTFLPGRRMHALFFADPEAVQRAVDALP